MAFITSDEVKLIRENLKNRFPNLKFSVSRINYSKVSVVIKSGDVDFINEYNGDSSFGINVNEFYFEKYFQNPEIRKMIEEIFTIIKSQNWYDNSDSMTDYFDTKYYFDLKIGDWNSEYKFLKKEKKRVA